MAQSPTRSSLDDSRQGKRSATEDLHDLHDEAGQRLADVSDKAKEVAAEAGERVGTMFEDQKKIGAEYIGKLARAAETAAGQLEREAPEVAAYLHRGIGQVKAFSENLTSRSPRELVDDVQDLARNNPAMFLGATALVGFAVSRFLKSSAPSTGTGSGRVNLSAQNPQRGGSAAGRTTQGQSGRKV
ncbi:MAG: hypothetical protein Q7T86_11890 [Hyphomicrobiaceae bacterium]|nr:hypothetical protein [Hyphomicrobiaceae bacterium]